MLEYIDQENVDDKFENINNGIDDEEQENDTNINNDELIYLYNEIDDIEDDEEKSSDDYEKLLNKIKNESNEEDENNKKYKPTFKDKPKKKSLVPKKTEKKKPKKPKKPKKKPGRKKKPGPKPKKKPYGDLEKKKKDAIKKITNRVCKDDTVENRKTVEKIVKNHAANKEPFNKLAIARFIKKYHDEKSALDIPKFSLEMVNDDKKLTQYLSLLHDDIDSTDELDFLLKEITNNILNQYKRFNDPRHLKSSNIEAVNELIKTRLDIKVKKINSKKVLFDILNKKKELDLKFRSVVNETNMVNNAFNIKDLLNSMDNENIHADIVIDASDHEFIGELSEGLLDTSDVADINSENKEDIVETVDIINNDDNKSIIPIEQIDCNTNIKLKMSSDDFINDVNYSQDIIIIEDDDEEL